MANMRVYELAKELNITTKDIADLLDNTQDSSNIIGVFPDPTPNAGFPEE